MRSEEVTQLSFCWTSDRFTYFCNRNFSSHHSRTPPNSKRIKEKAQKKTAKTAFSTRQKKHQNAPKKKHKIVFLLFMFNLFCPHFKVFFLWVFLICVLSRLVWFIKRKLLSKRLNFSCFTLTYAWWPHR